MVNETRGGQKADQRLNGIRELASLTSWKKQRDDGWYDTAPKDDRKRALIRSERDEEFGLCNAANTDTIDVSEWVATSQKKFKKNKIPETTNDNTIQLITFDPPYPSLCYWQNKYRKSYLKRRKGDKRRNNDKTRRIVRFTKEDPTIHLLHYHLDESFWYDLVPALEKNHIYTRGMNKAAMMISTQITTQEEATQSAEISVQTDVSHMTSRIINDKQNRPRINREKVRLPMNKITTGNTMTTTDNKKKTHMTNTTATAAPKSSYNNVSLTIIVDGEKYTKDTPPPEASATSTSNKNSNQTSRTTNGRKNQKRKREEVTAAAVESDGDLSVVSAKPVDEVTEITDGFAYTGNPLFKPKKIQKQQYWEHVSLVAPKKRLPKKQTEWTPNDTKRFYCSVCDREFAYTSHSSSQIKRHLEKDYHIARLI
jgi:hypothetical protein